MELLQWVIVGLCGITAVQRAGSAFSRNGALFWALTLLTLAFCLDIEGVYLATDHLLGEHNFTNLLIRLLLFAAFFLIGMNAMVGYGDRRGERLIFGPLGLSVLAAGVLIDVLAFSSGTYAFSSPGLQAFDDQLGVRIDSLVGRSYMAYVSLCVLPYVLRASRDRSLTSEERWIMRPIAGWFIGSALTLVLALGVYVVGDGLTPVKSLVSLLATLCLCVALISFWAYLLQEGVKSRRVAG